MLFYLVFKRKSCVLSRRRLEDGKEGWEEGNFDARNGFEAEEAVFDLGDELEVGGLVGGGSVEGDVGSVAGGEVGEGGVGVGGEGGGLDEASVDDVAAGGGGVAVAEEVEEGHKGREQGVRSRDGCGHVCFSGYTWSHNRFGSAFDREWGRCEITSAVNMSTGTGAYTHANPIGEFRMSPTNRLSYVVASAFFFGGITGCGSGSGGVTTPPTSAFELSLSPASVSMTQGAAPQTVQVSVIAQGSFTGSVTVKIPSVPNGVILTPTSLIVSPGMPQTFAIAADATAAAGKSSVSINGASVTSTGSAPLGVTISAAPNVPFPFTSVGGYLVHGFYDASRNVLFAANPELNELDVISANGPTVTARVPLPAAWGVDQMADGKTLVVGTRAQEIYTVDEDTYAVRRYPVTDLGISQYSLFYPNPIAMANGKVILIGQQQGIESSDILDGGQYLVEWDSKKGTFAQLTAPNGDAIAADILARSGDHKWAVFSSAPFFLYSSDADSLTAVPPATVDPPDDLYGIRSYAMNADGSKIAVVGAEQVTFTDRSLNVLATVPIPEAVGDLGKTEFSADGSRLFIYYGENTGMTGVETLDANSMTALGYYSAATLREDGDISFLDVDTNGRLYFGADGGLRTTETTEPPIAVAVDGATPGLDCPALELTYFPLDSPSQVMFYGAQFISSGAEVYLGGRVATVPATVEETNVDIPASPVAGPVGMECIDPGGSTSVLPEAISYGVQVAASSANLLPTIGRPTIGLFGYGILDSTFNSRPSITVGGTVAQVLSTNADAGGGDSLQGAAIQVPQGTPAAAVSITVSSANGTGTLANAVSYLPETTIVPATGLLQLRYDQRRSLLYALKAGEVDVLDPTTLQWKAPLALPGATSSLALTDMELSPDGTKMVLATSDNHLVIVDPDDPGQAIVYGCPSYFSFVVISIAITQNNVAIVTGPCNLALDLTNLTVKHGRFAESLYRASADGSHVYGVDIGSSGGTVRAVDASTFATQSEGFGDEFWADVAVSPKGDQFAAIFVAPSGTGDILAFFDPELHYSYENVGPLLSPPTATGAIGSLYSPQGKVVAVALGDSVEFWDAGKGTLRARLMTPEELNVLVYPEISSAGQIAFDSTGQYLYAVSASGLTEFKLPTPADELASVAWPVALHHAASSSFVYGTSAARMAGLRDRNKRLRPTRP